MNLYTTSQHIILDPLRIAIVARLRAQRRAGGHAPYDPPGLENRQRDCDLHRGNHGAYEILDGLKKRGFLLYFLPQGLTVRPSQDARAMERDA